MTVFENVAFGLRVKHRSQRPSEDQIQRKVHDLLGLVQLDWLADRYPAQLSGGQRQRIARRARWRWSRACCCWTNPLARWTPRCAELRRWLRRLHDELHVASVFVTHDQEEALEVADRVVLMNSGRIEQVGTPREVWESPATPFVYGFLGDVNSLAGVATRGVWQGAGLSLPAPELAQADGERATAYVRPRTNSTSSATGRKARASRCGCRTPTWPAPAPIWNWRARTRTPSSRPKCRNSCTGS